MSSDYNADEYLPTIDAILSVADLEKITVKKIRNALQELFNVNLTPHKQQINSIILDRYYSLIDKRKKDERTSEERKAEIEAQDAIMAARLSKSSTYSAVTRSGGRVQKKTKKSEKTDKRTIPNKNNPFNREMALSHELYNVLGIEKTSRPQVVKLLWAYIKDHELQNPKDKRQIICDDKLQKLFKKKSVGAFEMNKILSNHIFKIEEENIKEEEIKKLSYAGKTVKPEPKPKSETASDSTPESELDSVADVESSEVNSSSDESEA